MGFDSACEEARDFIVSRDNFLLVHHYDADGLSGGALVSAALESMGKDYRRLCFRKLRDKELDEVLKAKEKNVIFVDLGAGQADVLEGWDKNVVIIDHHQGPESSVLQVNPRLFGLDGSKELSGASTAYFVFRDPSLSPMGIVGAVGDMMHPLRGKNREMLEDGINGGYAKVFTDLQMFGRVSRPLIQFLAYSVDPYLPGLTGNEDNVSRFYADLGIPLKDGERWRTYLDLSEDEKKRLIDALVTLLYSRGRGFEAKRLIGEVYELLTYPEGTEMRDANEFSTLLNACGRHGQPDVGVNVMLKRPGAYEKARSLLEHHRARLREGIEYAITHVADMGSFYLLDARGIIEDGIIGVIAGMLYGSIKGDKPILALSLDSEGNIKLSTRATYQLTSRGLNLGRILSEACEGIGAGGGHDIAAGATIDPDKLDLFVQRFYEGLPDWLKENP